jgi:ABC-type lipoprotein export system ATPase subunit
VIAAWRASDELVAVAADALAERLPGAAERVRTVVEKLRAEAQAEVDRRQDAWRPIAIRVASWLPEARSAQEAARVVPDLKKAEAWLKAAAAQLRNERFAPIADEAAELWRLLRQRSNVQLGRIELEGTGTRRKVTLDVTVDGVAGAALGVMSQGELHALALSLFFPRATLDESPFRFIVVDDPVQSMDPSKVDGLARVLERAARARQVVVFTHDDRLPEVRRRRIGRGEEHAEVEELLASVNRTTVFASLALFDDETRAGDVLTAIGNRFSRSAADTFRQLNQAAHAGAGGNLRDLVREAAILARGLADCP